MSVVMTAQVDAFTMTDGELQFQCNSQSGPVSVVLRRLRNGDIETLDDVSAETTDIVCIGTCEIEPKLRIVSALEDVESGRLPPGSKVPRERRHMVNPDGTMRPNLGMNLDWMPEWR